MCTFHDTTIHPIFEKVKLFFNGIVLSGRGKIFVTATISAFKSQYNGNVGAVVFDTDSETFATAFVTKAVGILMGEFYNFSHLFFINTS